VIIKKSKRFRAVGCFVHAATSKRSQPPLLRVRTNAVFYLCLRLAGLYLWVQNEKELVATIELRLLPPFAEEDDVLAQNFIGSIEPWPFPGRIMGHA
jgi:hypothetical protein